MNWKPNLKRLEDAITPIIVTLGIFLIVIQFISKENMYWIIFYAVLLLVAMAIRLWRKHREKTDGTS